MATTGAARMEDSQAEPSMEEILASIRRIISEDEPAEGTKPSTEPAAESDASPDASDASGASAAESGNDAQPQPEPEPEPALEPAAKAPPAAPTAAAPEKKPAAAATAPAEQPAPPRKPEPAVQHHAEDDDHNDLELVEDNRETKVQEKDDTMSILAEKSASAATNAFNALSQNMQIARDNDRTLEELVTEALKPLLKEWLDEHLPAIVEEKVEEEIQRVARRRR